TRASRSGARDRHSTAVADFSLPTPRPRGSRHLPVPTTSQRASTSHPAVPPALLTHTSSSIVVVVTRSKSHEQPAPWTATAHSAYDVKDQFRNENHDKSAPLDKLGATVRDRQGHTWVSPLAFPPASRSHSEHESRRLRSRPRTVAPLFPSGTAARFFVSTA
ncbi:hypothetical protein SPRG_19373, partial [Saprolegnia parasitica CBS 223.65]